MNKSKIHLKELYSIINYRTLIDIRNSLDMCRLGIHHWYSTNKYFFKVQCCEFYNWRSRTQESIGKLSWYIAWNANEFMSRTLMICYRIGSWLSFNVNWCFWSSNQSVVTTQVISCWSRPLRFNLCIQHQNLKSFLTILC